jgi:hypothetical protein
MTRHQQNVVEGQSDVLSNARAAVRRLLIRR